MGFVVVCQSLLTREVSLQWGTARNPPGGETYGARAVAQIDLTNLFPKARDCGAEALVRFLREEEERLIGLLRLDRLPDGRHRYVRGGRYLRTLVTQLGKVVVEVGQVFDRLQCQRRR